MLTRSFSGIFPSGWTITLWIIDKPAFIRLLRECGIVLNSPNRLIVNDVLNANLMNDVLNVVK